MFLSRLVLPLLALGVGAFQIVNVEKVEDLESMFDDNVMENGLSLHRDHHDPIGASRTVSSRIVGGTDAPDGRYPYYTFVEIRTDAGTFICSATLIWEDILLTAAHCILDLQEAGLALNGVDAYIGLENQNMRDQAVYRQVELFVPNPNYNTITLERDVAIMKLVDPVASIQPAQISFDPNLPLDNQRVDVFGFGELSNGGAAPDQLQTVAIQVIPFNDCNDANSFDGIINDALMICAGRPGGGADSCNGDSGSPLIIPGTDSTTDMLVGLVSFGRGCAQPNFPGVYTRLSSVAPFIFNSICGFADEPPTNCANVGSPVLTPVTSSPAFSPTAPMPSPISAPSGPSAKGKGTGPSAFAKGKGMGGGGDGGGSEQGPKGKKDSGGMGMGGGGMGMKKRRDLEGREGSDQRKRDKGVRG